MDNRKKYTLFQLDGMDYPDAERNYGIFLVKLYCSESKRSGFGEVQMILDHIKSHLYVDEIPQLAIRLLYFSRQNFRGNEFADAAKTLCEEVIKAFWR